jgi:hypothetical protein
VLVARPTSPAAAPLQVGGGEPLGAVPSAAGLAAVAPAASNLSAFKLNVNNFTRELASTLNRANRDGVGPTQQGKPAMGQFRWEAANVHGSAHG